MVFYSEAHYGCANFAMFYEALPLMSKDKPREVSRLLDVTPATLQNYLTGKSTPPKSAVRLLFMESFYGVSAVTTHTANDLQHQRLQVSMLQAQNARHKETIEILERENADLKQAHASAAPFAANSERFRA